MKLSYEAKCKLADDLDLLGAALALSKQFHSAELIKIASAELRQPEAALAQQAQPEERAFTIGTLRECEALYLDKIRALQAQVKAQPEMPTRNDLAEAIRKAYDREGTPWTIADAVLALFAPKRDLHFALRPMELTQAEADELDRFRNSQ